MLSNKLWLYYPIPSINDCLPPCKTIFVASTNSEKKACDQRELSRAPHWRLNTNITLTGYRTLFSTIGNMSYDYNGDVEENTSYQLEEPPKTRKYTPSNLTENTSSLSSEAEM